MFRDTQVTRRVTALVAALLLTAGLAAGCGGGGGDDGDGVASIDGPSTENAEADGTDDGGGGGSRPDETEFQDAMLEYAQCMRDHGIDMPDPEFDENGGATQVMGPDGDGTGPDGPSEEFEAADEECRVALEDALPEMEVSPEEQAEMQDQMVAVAECMRAKGHDMPDPEVNSDGGISITRRAPAGGTTPADEEQFQEDMDACQDDVGFEGPGDGPVSRRDGGSDG
jgi:hypothetical protein